MSLQVIVAVFVGLAAALEDLARRQVSNWIPAVALVGGVVAQCTEKGWWGIPSALLGAVAGFLVFLAFYLLGGMGGGDVKLMAGFGSLLGAGRLLEAALWTAACGGLLAVSVVAVAAVRGAKGAVEGARRPRAIPYAPAIAVGVWLSLVPKQ
jgi:prepilin peptidase CpaA